MIHAVHILGRGFPKDGILKAKIFRRVPCTSLFPIDELLGDGRYVFLSVESVRCNRAAGFVFDAERLVKKGAMFRPMDVAMLDEAYVLEKRIRRAGGPKRLWDTRPYPMIDLLNVLYKDTSLMEDLKKLILAKNRMTLKGPAALRALRNIDRKNGYAEILVPRKLSLGESIGQLI